jgi:PadR family transcriptional regulator PadR
VAPAFDVDSRQQLALVSSFDIMTRHTAPDLLPGTLDLLILRTLQTQALHGWAIAERIQQISQDVLQINQGSLYPALHRLEHRGWIEAEWAVSELGRRAKYYELTPAGRRQLTVEAGEWERMSTAIGRVLKLA